MLCSPAATTAFRGEVDRLVTGGKQILRGATTHFLKVFEDSAADVTPTFDTSGVRVRFR